MKVTNEKERDLKKAKGSLVLGVALLLCALACLAINYDSYNKASFAKATVTKVSEVTGPVNKSNFTGIDLVDKVMVSPTYSQNIVAEYNGRKYSVDNVLTGKKGLRVSDEVTLRVDKKTKKITVQRNDFIRFLIPGLMICFGFGEVAYALRWKKKIVEAEY